MITKLVIPLVERAGKTFLQFYLGAWALSIGLLDTALNVPNSSAYDRLFTLDNVKAGVVGVAFSVFTSLGSYKIGSKDSVALVE